MNLKNNTPRMHHITPFCDEKFINFLGRGTALPQTPPLADYGASILASSALDLRPPQCSSGVDAHVHNFTVSILRNVQNDRVYASASEASKETAFAHDQHAIYILACNFATRLPI